MKSIFSEDEIIEIRRKLGFDKDPEKEELKEIDPKKKIIEPKT